ncbi:MAG TPA: hypothetical protein VFU02_08200 [Polyangiaceae bacterium]|nr:hypothetical protein [Polyangiaceae bacterium]
MSIVEVLSRTSNHTAPSARTLANVSMLHVTHTQRQLDTWRESAMSTRVDGRASSGARAETRPEAVPCFQFVNQAR